MKKIILAAVIILLWTGTAAAAPYIVCDPQAGVTHYKITGPSWITATEQAQADGSLKMDVAQAAVGSSSITVAACNTDPAWGEACSAAVPFVFTRPVPPATTKGIRLIP